MTKLDELETPLSEVESVLLSFVEEAYDLRYGVAGDPDGRLPDDYTNLDPVGLRLVLSRIRQRADRIEELLSKVTAIKARAHRAYAQANFEYESKFNLEIDKSGSKFDAYSSAAEKKAHADIQTFAEKKLAFSAKRVLDYATESYDRIILAHRGLRSIRDDIKSVIHTLQFESVLDQ